MIRDGDTVRLAETLEPTTVKPAKKKGAFVNLRLRAQLDMGVAVLRLLTAPGGPNSADDLEELRKRAKIAPTGLIERAAAMAGNASVADGLKDILAIAGLQDPDPARQVSAIKRLAEAPSARNLTLLLNMSTSLGGKGDAAVQKALASGNDEIKFWLNVGRVSATVYSGLSYASILFMAALGLAVIFGLMGVINLAQGELIMIGAYVTFLVQEALKIVAPGLLAGFFGALIAFAIALVGVAGLVDTTLSVDAILTRLQLQSPWFAAWIFIGVIAGVQLLAGLALFAAAEGIVRHVYRPYFNSRLSKKDAVTLTRVAVAILAVVVMIMQNLTPVTLSALAAVTLPMAFQLWTPLLGVTWIGWITRPAAVTGVGFGLAGVILTEPLGYEILSFFGLELPWGRWPWTIHSAAWGMAANLAAVLIISAITNRKALGVEASEIRKLFTGALAPGPKARSLRATAWSVVLAWFFLATGPGLIFGNSAFVSVDGETTTWLLGMPSIWAWSLAGWMSGVGLVWFLAYKMEMASPVHVAIPAYVPPRRLPVDTSQIERERLRTLIIIGAVGFVLAVLVAFSFGG